MTEGNPFFGNAFEKQSEFRKKKSPPVFCSEYRHVFGSIWGGGFGDFRFPLTFSSLVYHAPSARMIAGNRRNSLHTLRVESFSVLSFESTLGENRPQKSISKHPSQQTFFSSLLQTFKKNSVRQNTALKLQVLTVVQGDPGFFGVSVWYHGVAKMMTSNSLALLLAACVSVSGGIRELFSISSIPKTPLLFVFPGRHLQFSI